MPRRSRCERLLFASAGAACLEPNAAIHWAAFGQLRPSGGDQIQRKPRPDMYGAAVAFKRRTIVLLRPNALEHLCAGPGIGEARGANLDFEVA